LIGVDGLVNTRWLLRQLARSFVFGSADQIREAQNSTLCSFRVPRNSLVSFQKLQRILTAMPEVTLLNMVREN
jgi:hypothetical protein